MIRFDTLREMKGRLPEEVCFERAAVLAAMKDFVDPASWDDASFAELFGSSVFLVETAADLAEVRSFEEGANGRLSVLEAPSQWFDVAGWVEDGAYAVLGTIESSEGGPLYVIPRAVADRAPNVAETIRRKRAEAS